MEFLNVSKEDGIATITMSRGRVNAFNEAMIEELIGCFEALEKDPSVRGIILTGTGKFFSFGFDIPGFLGYPKDEFIKYLSKFAALYTAIYVYPKPVVAAMNGHAVAGACMLAIACDRRIMVSGKARTSLNEITFGSSVFAGSVEMLRSLVGQRNAERILFTGDMYSAEEAERMGLVDEAVDPARLLERARETAMDLAGKEPAAFKHLKGLLRKPIAAQMTAMERDSLLEFVEIWYSEPTWKKLQEIRIHS